MNILGIELSSIVMNVCSFLLAVVIFFVLPKDMPKNTKVIISGLVTLCVIAIKISAESII